MKQDLSNWAAKYESLTNQNQTIAAMAKYYTCSFMFDMEHCKVIIEMHDGKVKHINTDPGPLDAYDFALRASAATWREFSQPMPKPMFHGIWAASFPRRPEDRGQPPGSDEEPSQLHGDVRASAQKRRAGIGAKVL